ncbi:MAG: hypothetical protein U1E22_11025 [Coriobacteriia bacterium]|nr:hypothetical protein [Coriobacteriia bacterium]
MFMLVRRDSRVIVHIALDKPRAAYDGLHTGGVVFAEGDLLEVVEVGVLPDGVVAGLYQYIGDNFVPYISAHEALREEGREEIRRAVRDADKGGTITGPARQKLKDLGILS